MTAEPTPADPEPTPIDSDEVLEIQKWLNEASARRQDALAELYSRLASLVGVIGGALFIVVVVAAIIVVIETVR